MKIENSIKNSLFKILFITIMLVALFGILKNPKLSLNSASSGLLTWFNIVIPSLLPFFIISEILIRLGFVDFIGKMLEPIMRPLFNVPGEGAFPLSMSIISGYPVGVKLTSRLRQEKLLTKSESERLISFVSTSGPLFMLGAISIGMLNNPSLSPLIIYPHYLGSLTLGFLFRFFKKNKGTQISQNKKSIFENLKESYIRSTYTEKSIGSLISNSIKESMNSIILIGGFIVFYSVLVEILFATKFFNYFIIFLNKFFSLDIDLIKGIIAGIFELTTGCKRIAATNVNLLSKILIINFLIGWSGFSIHSQALSFISTTDINGRLYIFSKFLHGVLSTFYGYILYLIKYKNYITPSFMGEIYTMESFYYLGWPFIFTSSVKLAISITFYILLSSILVSILYKIIS